MSNKPKGCKCDQVDWDRPWKEVPQVCDNFQYFEDETDFDDWSVCKNCEHRKDCHKVKKCPTCGQEVIK